jgi:hypothetical protein
VLRGACRFKSWACADAALAQCRSQGLLTWRDWCCPAEQLTEGASALLELAKKSNATSPVEAQPQQPQKSVYLVGCRKPTRWQRSAGIVLLCRWRPALMLATAVRLGCILQHKLLSSQHTCWGAAVCDACACLACGWCLPVRRVRSMSTAGHSLM